MTIKNLYPTSRPTLDLNFAGTKRLDPRITFSRPTIGTYYDGVSQSKAEENLVVYSEDFTNAWWIKGGVTISGNAGTSPTGFLTADKIIASVSGEPATNRHYVRYGFPVSSASDTGSGATVSVYAKAVEHNFVYFLNDSGGSNQYVFFNLASGVVGATSGANISGATITPHAAASGWYRCSAFITDGGGTARAVGIGVSNVNGTTGFNGDGTSGALIWGAQHELRNTLTPYVATSGTVLANYIPTLLTAPAGQPRFDHNPATKESLGLLIEEQRTNHLVNSSLSQSTVINVPSGYGGWNPGFFVRSTAIDPTGNFNVLLQGALNANGGGCRQLVTGLVAGGTYTVSFYARIITPGELNLFQSYYGTTTGTTGGATNLPWYAGTSCSFAITNYLGTGASGGTSFSISSSWQRFTATCVADNAGSLGLILSLGGNSPIEGAIAAMWGAQLEPGTSPTSYIPTTSTSLTRVEDTASITGTNFSSWYNNAEGTLYAEMEWPSIALTKNVIASIIGGNAGVANGNNGWLRPYIGTAIPSPRFIKVALAQTDYRFGNTANYSSALNGTVGDIGGPNIAVGSGPPINLQIGRCDGNFINAPIRRFTYWPVRLSNTNLQNITR
jgi:hypothetical protein